MCWGISNDLYALPKEKRVAAGEGGLKRESSYSCSLTPRLIPSFWVKLDIPKRLGGYEKRFGCPRLNLTLNRIMQTRRYTRLLALPKLGNVLPSETIG